MDEQNLRLGPAARGISDSKTSGAVKFLCLSQFTAITEFISWDASYAQQN